MIPENQILCADALDGLRSLPDGCVSMCVTSPPYYGLRDYGVADQIGTEQTPAAYITRLVAVFREVRRVLRDDGTLWVNIADSYAGSGKGLSRRPVTEQRPDKQLYLREADSIPADMPHVWDGIKSKDMIGIPWMLAFALRADGWFLRSDIIWNKINCLPESVRDRPTKSYEHIFLLAKSSHYYYDAEAIKEPITESSRVRYQRGRSGKNKYGEFSGDKGINGSDYAEKMRGKTTRNKRDIWNISTNSYRMGGHFAMFPEKLVEPCILAGCPADGIVLDPFFGSGTTGAVAKRLGRQYIGIDINSQYCRMAQGRIDAVANELEMTEA